MIRKQHLHLGCILLLGSLVTGCREEKGEVNIPPGPAYLAYAKGKVDVEGGLVRLASARDGIVTSVLVKEGNVVKQGTLLATIDDRESILKQAAGEAEVAETRAQLPGLELRQRSAERDRARLARLMKQDVASQAQWEQADDLVSQLESEKALLDARLHLGEAHLATARHEVEQHQIRAPQDGIILRLLVHPGEGVSTQSVTPLLLFKPDSPFIVRVELDARFVAVVHPGDEVEIMSEDDESTVSQGKILSIGQIFGMQQLSGDANERADQRMVECIVSLGDHTFRIGQRVMVRTRSTANSNLPNP